MIVTLLGNLTYRVRYCGIRIRTFRPNDEPSESTFCSLATFMGSFSLNIFFKDVCSRFPFFSHASRISPFTKCENHAINRPFIQQPTTFNRQVILSSVLENLSRPTLFTRSCQVPFYRWGVLLKLFQPAAFSNESSGVRHGATPCFRSDQWYEPCSSEPLLDKFLKNVFFLGLSFFFISFSYQFSIFRICISRYFISRIKKVIWL